MKPKKLPPLKKLRTLLNYDPETGVLKWLKGRRVGLQAGHVKTTGYRTIVIEGVHYSAHRIAWALSGRKMIEYVGHKNGKRDDNRLCNLHEGFKCRKRQNRNS